MQDLLAKFPIKRIKADDGMAVTAEVWEEAHHYHRQSQSLMTLFCQGAGIITGLEVVASEPPDTSIYILPGIAIDAAGRTIVLPQPVAYDVGQDREGLLYLLLSYGEGRPKAANNQTQEGAPRYIADEFSITAQTTLPSTPAIELARVQRSSRNAVFLDAPNPTQPEPDQIDLRYRRHVGAPRDVSIAVSYLGESGNQHGQGAMYLATALNQSGRYRLSITDDVPIGPTIVTHALVYLVGQGQFEISAGAMKGLRNYVHRGNGTLFIESMDQEAEAAFMAFLKETEMTPAPIERGHRLLCYPNLFNMPPTGYITQGDPKLLYSEGVVFSNYNYGLLWQGQRQDRLAAREEIRSAIEWGANLVTYALSRQRT